MKKLVTVLSSLLIIMGLKAQTNVNVKKETTPQVKPVSTIRDNVIVKPIKDPQMKESTAHIKMTNLDSMKQSTVKGSTIKQTVPIKENTIPIKENKAIKFDNTQKPMKETPIKK